MSDVNDGSEVAARTANAVSEQDRLPVPRVAPSFAQGMSIAGRSVAEAEACETRGVSLICERSSQKAQSAGEDVAVAVLCGAVSPMYRE